MSASFNKVVLAGNLTRDPELRFTTGGTPVCEFGIAVNRVRSKDDSADYFNVVAWRQLGETIANYKSKGDAILIEGRLQYSSWETEDGQRRSKVSVVAENVQFLSNGGGSSNGNGGSAKNAKQPATIAAAVAGAEASVDEEDFEDDIPF